MNGYYSSGQAARQLNTSQDTVRALCSSGTIQAQSTPGGQWRIAKTELERLRRDGLPPIPRPLPGGTKRPAARNQGTGLLAPPSAQLADSAEEVQATRNLLEKRRLELELHEVEDTLRRQRDEQEEQQRELEAAAERRRREELELRRRLRDEQYQENRRRRWTDSWIAYAMSRAHEAPADTRLRVHEQVGELLDRLSPGQERGVIGSLVDAATERALAPWRREQRKQKAVEEVCKRLPLGARGFLELTQWEKGVRQLAPKAIDQLAADASFEEMVAAATPVADQFIRAYCHLEELMGVADVPGTSPVERKAIWEALRKLPTGAPKEQMQEARDRAIAALKRTA